MLNGDVDIMKDFLLSRHDVYQLVGNPFWVAVQKSYPFYAIRFTYPVKQFGQLQFPVNIQSIASGILSYYHQLLYSAGSEALYFLKYIFHGTASEAASYIGDGAIGAAVVAAVGYS